MPLYHFFLHISDISIKYLNFYQFCLILRFIPIIDFDLGAIHIQEMVVNWEDSEDENGRWRNLVICS